MYGATQLRSCLVPVVDDAGLDQIGDPVADRPRMDAETLLAAERVGHRLGSAPRPSSIVAWSGIRRATWSAMARSIGPAGRAGSSIGGTARFAPISRRLGVDPDVHPGVYFPAYSGNFRSSSLPARQNSLGPAVGVHEIFGETVISIRNK